MLASCANGTLSSLSSLLSRLGDDVEFDVAGEPCFMAVWNPNCEVTCDWLIVNKGWCSLAISSDWWGIFPWYMSISDGPDVVIVSVENVFSDVDMTLFKTLMSGTSREFWGGNLGITDCWLWLSDSKTEQSTDKSEECDKGRVRLFNSMSKTDWPCKWRVW